jgi:hypothetical protein
MPGGLQMKMMADLGYVSCSGCSNNFTTRMFGTRRAINPPPGPNPGALKYLNTNTWLNYTYSDNASPGVAPTEAAAIYWGNTPTILILQGRLTGTGYIP